MDLIDAVRAAPAVVAVGGRTQWEIGGPVDPGAREVRAPAGVIAYDPADLTISVGAGTSVADLESELAAHGQECPFDAADGATVGGVLAAGLSGIRRLRNGPVRDLVLEVRFVTGDGRLVKGGGPTVKNVSGYDLPRLLVGSLGTLGVLTQVTLRARPRPRVSAWRVTEQDPARLLARLFRPSALLWDGSRTSVLLEGDAGDVRTQAAGMRDMDAPPELPAGRHRGRISVAPTAIERVTAALSSCRWVAELGVGTIHVAADSAGALAAARRAAAASGGWLLVEAGGDGMNPFGASLPNLELLRRIKLAFDPDGRLGPGRMPFS